MAQTSDRQSEKEHSEQPTSEARRKALREAIPLAFGTLVKAQETLLPFSISQGLSQGVRQLDAKAQQHTEPINGFLRKKIPELQYLDLTSEKPGQFRLLATRESVLSSVVCRYLRRKLNEESSFTAPFRVFAPRKGPTDAESYDCELSLTAGSVFGRLIQEKPQVSAIVSLQSQVVRANLSKEVWLFTTSRLKKEEENDLLLDPLFASEKRLHPGRIMVVGLETVFAEVIGNEKYSVQSVELETRADEQHALNQMFKITLIENTAKKSA